MPALCEKASQPASESSVGRRWELNFCTKRDLVVKEKVLPFKDCRTKKKS